MAAYAERRARELRETGSVTALAFNDPKQLAQVRAGDEEPRPEQGSGEYASWSWGGKGG
jgi:hypothetical protein